MGRIRLPDCVEIILLRLNSCGYEAYVVGGCVRDSILGVTPNDWDICTSARPDEVKSAFSNYKVIPTGIKHGTVTVVMYGNQYEITTYRIDGDYSDCRHPDKVEFTSDLYSDLSRRDFTINAMAYNHESGLIDYYGGSGDIVRRVIKCVGNPDDRFKEDALRMMRAVRFATTLGYSIEGETWKAIQRNKFLLRNVSMERINSELVKAFSVDFRRELAETLQVVIPEIDDAMIDRAEMESYFATSLDTRLLLLLDFPSAQLGDILKRMRFDNHKVRNLVDAKDVAINLFNTWREIDPAVSVKRILKKNERIAGLVSQYMRCIGKYQFSVGMVEYAKSMNECIERCRRECHSLKQLAVSGDDLSDLGLVGKEIGKNLDCILDAVIDGKIKNNREDILNFLKITQVNY